MLRCPVCIKEVPVNSVNDVRVHLNWHKKNGHVNPPLRCKQHALCQTLCADVYAYVKHFKNQHEPDVLSEHMQLDPCEIVETELEPHNSHAIEGKFETIDTFEYEEFKGDFISIENKDVIAVPIEEKIRILEDRLKCKAMDIVLSLRSKGNVPYTVSVDIMKQFSDFINIMIDEIVEGIQGEFELVSDTDDLKPKVQLFSSNLSKLQ
jgi:hypothetical protein